MCFPRVVKYFELSIASLEAAMIVMSICTKLVESLKAPLFSEKSMSSIELSERLCP